MKKQDVEWRFITPTKLGFYSVSLAAKDWLEELSFLEQDMAEILICDAIVAAVEQMLLRYPTLILSQPVASLSRQRAAASLREAIRQQRAAMDQYRQQQQAA